jgi:hypothetical protein
MTTKALKELLTTHGQCTASGDTIEVGEEGQVAIFASIGSESLVVNQVRKVELLDEMIFATTAKGDAFAILAEDVRAVRFGKTQGKRPGLVG